MSACAVCQGQTVLDIQPWSQFSAGCDQIFNRSYPRVLPRGIAVQAWAYLPLTMSLAWLLTTNISDVLQPYNRFDLVTAQILAEQNPVESHGPPVISFDPTDTEIPSTSQQVSVSTVYVQETPTTPPTAAGASSSMSPSSGPETSNTSPASPSTNHIDIVGVAAGSVIGGAVSCLAAAALVFWMIRRRHRAMHAQKLQRRHDIVLPSSSPPSPPNTIAELSPTFVPGSPHPLLGLEGSTAVVSEPIRAPSIISETIRPSSSTLTPRASGTSELRISDLKRETHMHSAQYDGGSDIAVQQERDSGWRIEGEEAVTVPPPYTQE
ncbi:hypothetical protein BD309DRAFT_35254 [Dichomitus squalens]|nr:hypothetical protein BD309DRAFT_35254 [Dichomitus squalens]